jgi:putative protease
MDMNRDSMPAEELKSAGRVYVPFTDWLAGAAEDLPNALPRIPFYTDLSEELTGEDWERLRGCSAALAGSPGHLLPLKRHGITVLGDYSLNAYNALTLRALSELGFAGATLSHELTMEQIELMPDAPPEREAAVYGRLPLMVSAHCPIGAQAGRQRCGRCEAGSHSLTDRKGVAFPLVCDRSRCVCTVLNGDILAVPQLAARLGRSGIRWLRLYIHDETPQEVARLLALFSEAAHGGMAEPMGGRGYTKGHYFRGV